MKAGIKVGVIQMKIEADYSTPSLKGQNIDHALELLDKIGREKPDIVVMPDEWYSGHAYGPMSLVDFRRKGGFETLGNSAKKNGFYIAGSVMDPSDNPLEGFNQSFSMGYIINPDGEIAGKTAGLHHAPQARLWAIAGEKPEIVKTGIGTFGFLIGYDVFYPEIARIQVLKGAEILINPMLIVDRVEGFQHTEFGNDYYSMKHVWRTCALARAYENQVFLIGTCGVGTYVRTDGLQLVGSSFVAGPAGLKREASDGEELFTCEILNAEIATTRKLFDILENRKESLNILK